MSEMVATAVEPEPCTEGAGDVFDDLALVVAAWALYKRHWAHPEYTLFWRHATSW